MQMIFPSQKTPEDYQIPIPQLKLFSGSFLASRSFADQYSAVGKAFPESDTTLQSLNVNTGVKSMDRADDIKAQNRITSKNRLLKTACREKV